MSMSKLTVVYQCCHRVSITAFLMENPAVSVRSLTYSHSQNGPSSLDDVSLELPKGSRTLLIGANGAVSGFEIR